MPRNFGVESRTTESSDLPYGFYVVLALLVFAAWLYVLLCVSLPTGLVLAVIAYLMLRSSGRP